jgi:hypothetical protein
VNAASPDSESSIAAPGPSAARLRSGRRSLDVAPIGVHQPSTNATAHAHAAAIHTAS